MTAGQQPGDPSPGPTSGHPVLPVPPTQLPGVSPGWAEAGEQWGKAAGLQLAGPCGLEARCPEAQEELRALRALHRGRGQGEDFPGLSVSPAFVQRAFSFLKVVIGKCHYSLSRVPVMQ